MALARECPRMVEAREAFDLSREPVRVHRLYGDTAMGRQCMLEETLFVWAGEFGRTPTTDHNGGLQLDSAARLRRGGVSGAVVVPGKPEESRLLHAVRGEKGMEAMPPDDPLTEAEIADLTRWIETGAADPRTEGGASLPLERLFEQASDHWAFQPIITGDFTIETYPGPHRVEVYADKKESRPIRPDDPPELAFVLTSLIPERYNKKSTLTVDVQSPSDRPEFVLTTRKE